jgi:hypothetical protein
LTTSKLRTERTYEREELEGDEVDVEDGVFEAQGLERD